MQEMATVLNCLKTFLVNSVFLKRESILVPTKFIFCTKILPIYNLNKGVCSLYYNLEISVSLSVSLYLNSLAV